MDGEELDVKEFLINGEFVKVAVRLSGGPLFKKNRPRSPWWQRTGAF